MPPRWSMLLTDQEVELLDFSLQRWRLNIGDDDKKDKLLFYDEGQRVACRFTTNRIDEMRERLHDFIAPKSEV